MVLAEGASDSFFEIQHYFSDSQWMREDGCNGIKDCFVVLLFFARHYDEKQWHLLHMIIVLYKGVWGQQLSKWLSAQFENSAYLPHLRLLEHFQFI